jgi:catechol 2,3-dioxygenase-like lactoylglutathione lyase family enzyme
MSFDAIGIVTADYEKAIRFYKLLGVEFVRGGGHEHFEAKTSTGIRLLLDSVALIQKFEPDFAKVRGTGVSLRGTPLTHCVTSKLPHPAPEICPV